MPCPCARPESEEDVEAKQRTKLIDKELKADQRHTKKQIKLLLLGAGASGKSTFVRQMRIIHGSGFAVEERLAIRTIIYDNVVSCVQTLVTNMQELGIRYAQAEHEQLASQLGNIRPEKITTPEEFAGIVDWVADFWSDSGVRACYEQRSRYQILDSCRYYLDDVKRLGHVDYEPSNDDIIRCRSPTVSILEYPFELDTMMYHIVDVGGQRTERRKWLFCFEGITSVIFLAALSEYTHAVELDGTMVNGLCESQALMAQVMRSRYLYQSSFILFLNKSDVFEEQIQRHHLADYLPGYDGPKHNSTEAYNFVENMFLDAVPTEREQLKKKRSDRNDGEMVVEEPLMYCHRTTATDTENIRRIFTAVRDTLLENYLAEINIV